MINHDYIWRPCYLWGVVLLPPLNPKSNFLSFSTDANTSFPLPPASKGQRNINICDIRHHYHYVSTIKTPMYGLKRITLRWKLIFLIFIKSTCNQLIIIYPVILPSRASKPCWGWYLLHQHSCCQAFFSFNLLNSLLIVPIFAHDGSIAHMLHNKISTRIIINNIKHNHLLKQSLTGLSWLSKHSCTVSIANKAIQKDWVMIWTKVVSSSFSVADWIFL